MALWCATTLDRTRLAKCNVNEAMTLSSLLPFFITALEEIGARSQLVLTIQSYHGQTAQVSAMNFSYNCTCCLWALGLYICARGFRRAYNGGAYILWGFQWEYKKCFETSYSDADQNASLILTFFFFFFSISKLHNKSNSFQYKLEGREAYNQGT